MKNNYLKLFVILILAILGLSSCNNEDMPSKINESFISLEASADLEQPIYEDIDSNDDDSNLSELRGLNYKLVKSKTKKKHPSIELDYQKNATVNIVAIIQNSKSGQKIIKNLNWKTTDSGKNWSLHRLDGGSFTDAIQITDQHKNDWKLFLIMGGEYNEQNKTISFDATGAIKNVRRTPNKNNKLNTSSIYMPKDGWIDLSFAKGENGVFEFKAKKKISLRNVGTFFAVTLNNQYARRWIHSFDFSVNNYRFTGKYNLKKTVVGETPRLIASESSSNKKITPVEDIISPFNQPLPGYFLLWGVPTDEEQSTIGGQVTVGELRRKKRGPQDGTVEISRAIQKNINLEKNKIYGVAIRILAPEPKAHPIEQFKADANGNIITRYRANTSVDKAIKDGDPTVEVERSGKYIYNVPEQNEYRIIAPGTDGGGTLNLGHKTSGERPMVMMYDSRSFGAFTETVKTFGEEVTYTSHVINTGGINSYAIRFKGGNNQYYSAYRYQKQNGRVKITVRVLGPSRTNIGIDQVKQPSWWDKPIQGVREIVRYIPNGTWMSSTKAQENNLVRHTLNVFPPEEDALAGHKDDLETKGVYTTNHALWGRLPGLSQNSSFGSLLIAEQK